MQQAGTEGVNGAHLQAARRLQRAGKQLARQRALLRAGGLSAHLAHRPVQRRYQLLVVQQAILRGIGCRNPLENIRSTNTIRYVMKNGRLYDGNTLDEVYPTRKQLPAFAWQRMGPVTSGGGNNQR